MSPNKNYVSGRAFEYKRKKAWEAEGYSVFRTAGSHGVFDLIAFHALGPPTGIQCKRCTTDKEAARLLGDFKRNPPFTPSKYFHQVMEVYVKSTKELQHVTV